MMSEKRREIVDKIRGPEDGLMVDKESEYGTQGKNGPVAIFTGLSVLLETKLNRKMKQKCPECVLN